MRGNGDSMTSAATADIGSLIASADAATRGQDWLAAVARWAEVLESDPEYTRAYTEGAFALDRCMRLEDADNLLRAGMERLPDQSNLASAYVWAAARRQDFPEANKRFDVAKQQFPGASDIYHVGSHLFEWQVRFDEAEELLSEGMRRCPDDPGLALHLINVISGRLERDATAPARAIACLNDIRRRFPDFAPSCAIGIKILNKLKEYAAADDLARSSLRQWPDDWELLVEYANGAAYRSNWTEALARFEILIERHPNIPEGYLGIARAQEALGDHAAADNILSNAIEKMPGRLQLYTAFAEMATRQSRWQEAVARWRVVHRQFPNDATVAQNLNAAEMVALGTESDASGAAEGTAGTNTGGEAGELLMRFESLGGADRQGCEFGLLQRDAGAEPLGLLRWSSIEPDELVLALQEKFVGIGEPEQTVIEVHPSGHSEEYVTHDTRYGMLMHTGMSPDSIAKDKAMGVFGRRLQFLANKLIGDLEAGEKIFVYRMVTRDLTYSEVHRLHAAVRSYGDGKLLYVRYEDADHPNGTVELVKPGLLIGYIDRFAFDRSGKRLGSATASWLTLCRQAFALSQRPA